MNWRIADLVKDRFIWSTFSWSIIKIVQVTSWSMSDSAKVTVAQEHPCRLAEYKSTNEKINNDNF
jgi:hypothetical protein